MSDELDRINRQLDAKGAQDTCLVCAGSNLIIDVEARYVLFASRDQTVDVSRGVENIAVVCGDCGFVRLHSTSQLLDSE